MSSECGVRVVCRFRPLNQREKNLGEHMSFLTFEPTNTSVVVDYNNKRDQFHFDAVFGGEEAAAAAEGREVSACTQEQVWKEVGEKGVTEVTQGYMATIFAYGQTGAGKSFTMLGPDVTSDDRGIIPRACQAIFQYIEQDNQGIEFQVKCSFLEIYKEAIRDLLCPGGNALRVRETPQKGVWVDGLSERFVGNMEEVMQLLATGEKFRASAFTQMNAASSRSHSLFSITLSQKTSDGSEKIGKLYLVDLAGSEKVAKTGASGNTLKEAMKINQSLSALGNCINALSKASGKKGHIPYRDSKLTHILKEALGGNSKTTLLIACSPHSSNVDETVSTLRFGRRAKTIKNKVSARIHRSVEELNSIILQLQKEVSYLRKHTRLLEEKLLAMDSSIDIQEIKTRARRPSILNTTKGSVTEESVSQSSWAIIPPTKSPQKEDEKEEDDEEDEEEEFNPIPAVELQVALDKLKEQSESTIIHMEEKLKSVTELLDEKEEELQLLREQMLQSKQRLQEAMAKQESERIEAEKKSQALEKQLYDMSLELEKAKQRAIESQSEASTHEVEAMEKKIQQQGKSIESLETKNERLAEEVHQKQRLLQLAEERIQTAVSEYSEEREEGLRKENRKLSELLNEIRVTTEAKTLTIENLENEISRLEKALEVQNESSSIDYQKEKNITRLEIDLEGQQRLCKIQETRCNQLQKLVDDQTTQLSQLREESENRRKDLIVQEEQIASLQRQVELYQEAELLQRGVPKVRVVKPISQPRSISSIIGQRKKRENLPKRFSIQTAEKEGYLTKQGGFIRSWRRRWFVLKDNPPLLYYFENPKGAIALDGCVLKEANQETKRQNTMGIYHQVRTYYLQASSAEEMADWTKKIEQLLT